MLGLGDTGKLGQKETYNLGRDHSQGESVIHSAPVNIQLSGSSMWTAASLNTPFFFFVCHLFVETWMPERMMGVEGMVGRRDPRGQADSFLCRRRDRCDAETLMIAAHGRECSVASVVSSSLRPHGL